jgi:hypothetical protein
MAATENDNSIASHTRSKSTINSDIWDQLNDALKYAPKFQNKHRPGVDEQTIQYVESKLGITLPKEVRDIIKIHDGRDHIGFGLSYRLATTDLLPITKWRPYEKEGEGYTDILFECLTGENNRCVDENLRIDAQGHLAAYIDDIKNAEQQSKNNKRKTDYDLENNDAFHGLPCELLVIGEGMDDYAEQYLLSIRSGRIYLAIHNIPEWTLIGSFTDWITMGIENAIYHEKYIQNQHDDI